MTGESTLQGLFEAQVALRPGSIATVFEGETLTYDALNRKANRLAHRLRRIGVVPDDVVGVCLERSTDMVAAVLGIVKAGAAYLPIDPEHPPERSAFVLGAAGARLVVTDETLVPHLAAAPASPLLLGDPWTGADDDPEPAGAADNLLYVLHTSGSTGRPKAIAMSRGAHRNLLDWYLGQFGPRRTMLQFASLTFDMSLIEMTTALCSGGTLVLIPRNVQTDVDALLERLVRQAVEVAMLPVVMVQELAEIVVRRGDPGLHLAHLVSAGEQLVISPVIAEMFERLPACRLHNHYGPTETHVVTGHTFAGAPASWPSYAPIGRPVSNLRVYVLDRHLRPVPPGVIGEVYVGGVGLARCYSKHPGLTAERFMPSPFDPAGGRLFRTGDLARHVSNGVLECRGRADWQVKVRGNRVEPAEVEAALVARPGVREAVVVARDADGGSKELVAYLVAESGLEIDQVRRALRDRLPDYMVPTAWSVLERFPLTASGKVDRLALPPPMVSGGGPPAHPVTETEHRLAGIWEQVFRRTDIGMDDDFFDLGGHSLLAMRVASRVRETFGVELDIRTVFSAPTVRELAASIDRLSPGAGSGRPPIRPAGSGLSVPASYGQQRLWFIDRLVPGSPALNLLYAWRLRGHLDVDVLEWAVNRLIQRHEVLRTRFAAPGGEPIQIVEPSLTVGIERIEVASEEHAAELLRTGARRPFDLTRCPLLRVELLALGHDDHVLGITLHHIATDAWSMEILRRELSVLYTAMAAGGEPQLPDLPARYADYAIWQREWLESDEANAQLAYWVAHLRDAPAVLELQSDRPRSGEPYRGDSVAISIDPELTARLRLLALGERTSLHVVLLAAYQGLLARYTGQKTILVGTPVANRPLLQFEDVMGFYVNTLTMRADVGDDPTFRELVRRVRAASLAATASQDLPFSRLVAELRPGRHASRNPLVQVTFQLLTAEQERLDLRDLEVERFPVSASAAHFDLQLLISETSVGLAGRQFYDAQVFDRWRVASLADNFERLLRRVAETPDRRLADLPVLAPQELTRQLSDWNRTEARRDRPATVPELFQAQVARSPDAVAVTSESETLTYAELSRRANRLAHRLRLIGAGPDDVVGLCADRSPEMVVAVLGILKSGAAYLPLAADDPRDRLAFMLDDAGVRVVVAQPGLRDRLPLAGRHLLVVVAGDDAAGDPPAVDPEPLAGPGNLAYVVYTSGSTGRPKAVAVEHRGLANNLLWRLDRFDFRAPRRFVQKAALSFGVSTWEMLCPLLSGAGLVLARPGGHRDPRYLWDLVRHFGVDAIHFSPTMLRAFLDAAPAGEHPLRELFVGGEPLMPELLGRASGELGATVHNLYGPTEATTGVLSATFDTVPDGAVPIGWPMANTQVYVLDDGWRPVPIGAAGELFIGGVQLARGYLGQPGMTAERFVPGPFGLAPGSRLYRTGDLVRYRPDGAVELLGRLDDQVKIRGFRIELGEIEATLLRHAAVGAAVVVARGEDERSLVACVVPRAGQMLELDSLRDHLRRALPPYMMPAAIVLLEQLPLTHTGKVDRQALTLLAPGRGQAPLAAPATEVERTIAGAWSSVLGIADVGLYDNFFDLGGHSLLMVRLHDLLTATFPAELTLLDLYQYPTVSALANHLSRTEPSRPAAPRSEGSSSETRQRAMAAQRARRRREQR